MKVFVRKFSDGKSNRNIKSLQESECVNFSDFAYSKLNCDKVLQYSTACETTGKIISSQDFHDELGNLTHRPHKTKNLSLGKRKVQTIHKLKELRVILKKLPEVWLRKKQVILNKINKNLSNEKKCTSRNTVEPKSCSDVNKKSCSEIEVQDSFDFLSTPNGGLCRRIADSSAIQDNELKLFLSKFNTKYPEIVLKELHVSVHKLPCNLNSYNWSQIEHVHQKCKYCHITVNNRTNQGNYPFQTTLNKTLTCVDTSKKLKILPENESYHKNFDMLIRRRPQRKWHLNCLFCSEDGNNENAAKKSLSKKYRGNESVRTLTPYVRTEPDFSEAEMDADTSYVSAKESKHRRIHHEELWRMRRVSPLELIEAVKYAMHLALTEPWLELDVSGPPECCESRHRAMVLHWMNPDVRLSGLFRNVFLQGLWFPAFSLLEMMVCAGLIPQPDDMQNFLLFVMTTEDQILKQKGLTIIEMFFNLWPVCCLHTGSYYSTLFRKPHKVGCQDSNGLLLSMVAVLHFQLTCKVEMASDVAGYSASVIKVVVNALAADVASWLSRHQIKKCTEPKYGTPLAQIALGQTENKQIQLYDVKNIVNLCIRDWPTLHHDIFMDVVRLVAEVYRISYAVPLKEYPGLGTDCHLLASEIVSQIEDCGMESERVEQFLCVLKPNWLSMLVGQKLLEKVQGPLRGSVIDTVTSYILEYKEFLKRELAYAEDSEKHKISTQDKNKNSKTLNKRDYKGEVQLHRSCRRGNITVVHRILAVPGVDVNIRDNAGWTPLHEAVHYGHTACVQALLNFVPSPGSPYVYTAARADCGTTPLISAAVAGDVDMCNLLLQHTGIVLLEDILEGDDIKPHLRQHIPEELQSLLKKAKFKYENIIEKHLGVSLSVSIWDRLHPLLVPLVCSHMATYHIPLIRRQFGPAWCGAVHIASTHVEYSTVQQILRSLRSFEKMRKVIKKLCKCQEIPVSAINNFQSYI